jgi:hypothetical protein
VRRIGMAVVWNENWVHNKKRTVVGYVESCEYPHICNDGSMWKNMELIQETELDKIEYWLGKNIPSHHSSGEYKCYPNK